MWFSAFSDIFCAEQSQVLSLWKSVNLEDETSELIKSTQELNNGSLSKMGFTKVGGKCISKDGDHGASSSGTANLEQD